ncbi:MAG: DNA-binding protein [Cytophagaceae bacterium]|nr:DNA-binding protein [Cytophagaceae bacterium]
MAQPTKTQARPQLDGASFDALFAGPAKLWGLEAIARAIGCSVDKTRRLARNPRVPIYRPEGSGSYFAFRHELEAWLRGTSTGGGASSA